VDFYLYQAGTSVPRKREGWKDLHPPEASLVAVQDDRHTKRIALEPFENTLAL
jgi:hypothetical protein